MHFQAFSNRGTVVPLLMGFKEQLISSTFLTKMVRIMKMMAVAMLIFYLHVSARGVSQHITFSGRNVSLQSVFKEIEKQSGYVVLSSKDLLKEAGPVTISVRQMPLQRFLEMVLEDRQLEFQMAQQTIFIRKKQADIMPPPGLSYVVIRGMVTDPQGTGLAGATVSVKGRGRSTVTDAQGQFSIAANQGDILVISFIGYETYQLTVGNAVSYSIRMTARVSQIDSFIISPVNTGYQKILPQQVTGAVSQIRTRDYESKISTDFLSGLQNRLPGLLINNDVQFQGNNLFQIRGISTMTGNPRPLIVLDGYPTDLSLNDINPNEIETVTILKDAAAAAIYGVRASNGVIIIDRKKGIAGNTKFAFRSTVGIRPRENYSRYRYDPDGSVKALYSKNYWQTSASSSFNQYRDEAINGIYPLLYGGTGEDIQFLVDYSLGKITKDEMDARYAALTGMNNANDYEEYFLRNQITSQYNLNVSGGTSKALYYLTGNYYDNRSGLKNNNDKKAQLSGRSNIQLNKRLSLELLTDYNESVFNIAPVPNFNDIYPYEKFADDNGNPLPIMAGSAGAGSMFTNATVKMGYYDQRNYPLREMNEVNTRRRIADWRTTVNLKYKITSSLDLSLGGIYENSQMQQRRYATENSSLTRQLINRYMQPATGTTPIVYNVPRGGYLQRQDSLLRSFTGRAQLSYNKQFSGDHSLNAILGTEIRKITTEGTRSAYFGYNDQALLQQAVDYYKLINSGTSFNSAFIFYNPTVKLADLFGQTYNEDRYVSGYANAVYAYKNKYSVTGSIRIDQSNLFGTDPKYRYKPLWSAGAAWNINKENFMQDVNWVNMLKLRIAYGFNGNVSRASLPQVIAVYAINDVTTARPPVLNLSSPANSGLRWEQTENLNAGIDFTLFRHISGNIDVYTKRSTDVLGNIDIDPFKGVTPALVNQASINNRGIEFTLNADWLRKRKLNWNTGFVMSYNRSKVINAYVPKPTVSILGTSGSLTSQQILTAAAGGYMKGEPVGIIYSYRYAGVNNAGTALYYNSKGQAATITTATDEGFASLDSRGTSIPALNMGLSNRLDIGNFYFFCMLNFYGQFVVKTPIPNPSVTRPIAGSNNFWRVAGDEKGNVLPSSFYLSGFGNSYLANSDRFIMNGAYFTVGDVTVSYNLRDVAFLKKTGFTNFEIKAQASNLYTHGFNRDNYSIATGSYLKTYITPTYTLGLFTNF